MPCSARARGPRSGRTSRSPKELPPTLPSIGTKTCPEVEAGAGPLPRERTLSLSRNNTSEAVLKCKSAFIACEFYKGNILIPKFVEDLEDKDNHSCNCHWDDWCNRKPGKLRGWILGEEMVIKNHAAKKEADVTEQEDNLRTRERPDEAGEVKEE